MVKAIRLNFPKQAAELQRLLEQDQQDWRVFAQKSFSANHQRIPRRRTELRRRLNQRAERLWIILEEIKQPSISNIGANGAIATSILACHTSLDLTKHVLNKFLNLHKHQPDDTHYQSIPAMVDWACVLERKPQLYGTIWLFDKNKSPYLPTVADVDHVNDRRAKFGLEPLHWPKSLAISESEQPWLNQPLTELTMRDITDEEFQELTRDL